VKNIQHKSYTSRANRATPNKRRMRYGWVEGALGWGPDGLAQYHCVFEYANASEAQKGIDTSYLFRSLLTLAVDKGLVNARLSNIIVLEDAYRFLASGNEVNGGVTPIAELLSIIRGAGVGIIALVQSLANIPIGVLANLSNRVMFRLSTDQDYRQLAADMNMTAQQREWAKRHLRPGLGLMTVSDGLWREPFLLRSPLVEFPEAVTDIQAHTSLKHLTHLPVIRATEFDNFSAIESVTVAADPGLSPEGGNQTVATNVQSSVISGIPADELKFLQAIHQNLGLNASAFRQVLGFGSDKTVRLRRLLIKKGWVKETPVQKNAKGRAAKVLSLTAQGEAIIQESEVSP
ncbi:MAG: hypothetical protein ACE37H_01830, partial [Phycisphaeraceae bacterium]